MKTPSTSVLEQANVGSRVVSNMPKAIPTPYPQEALENPHYEEEKNVHEVYDQIAPHFSQTRFKVSSSTRAASDESHGL
jgi:hypothetical protein